jgi:hypothetical protein
MSNNPALFNAVVQGCTGGKIFDRSVANPSSDFLDSLKASAEGLAMAVDALVEPTSVTDGMTGLMQTIVSNFEGLRSSGVPYEETAQTIVQLWSALLDTLEDVPGGNVPTVPPYTEAAPLGSGDTYQLKSTDGILYVSAGAIVIFPAAPALQYEYLVKVVVGTAEESPVNLTAGGEYSVEDPGGADVYTRVTGDTPATMKISAACNGWMYDGNCLNLTR